MKIDSDKNSTTTAFAARGNNRESQVLTVPKQATLSKGAGKRTQSSNQSDSVERKSPMARTQLALKRLPTQQQPFKHTEYPLLQLRLLVNQIIKQAGSSIVAPQTTSPFHERPSQNTEYIAIAFR